MENNVTIKELVESLSNLGDLKNLSLYINLHNKISLDSDTKFSEVILPQDKAVLLFGNYKTLYISTCRIGEFQKICIKCGIAIIKNEI